MPLLLSALLDNWRAPPPDETRRLRFLTVQPFAHRGLHGGRVIENSRAAFRAGMAQGHGIECDVQVSKDGTAYVFHDYDLDRLTDASGKVELTVTAKECQDSMSGAVFPFSAVLAIDSGAPLTGCARPASMRHCR